MTVDAVAAACNFEGGIWDGKGRRAQHGPERAFRLEIGGLELKFL